MAPDVKGNFDAAERRRQMIQESKFLGGDMEHTHLVKGLDFFNCSFYLVQEYINYLSCQMGGVGASDMIKLNYFKKQQKLVLTFPYLR